MEGKTTIFLEVITVHWEKVVVNYVISVIKE